MEYAPDYFDPSTFPENSETRRALQRVLNKASGPRGPGGRWSRADSSQKTGKLSGADGELKKKKKRKERQ
jgi:pre-mRNA-splicing factor ATP-dependent RNA helicase DHX15/PRP43